MTNTLNGQEPAVRVENVSLDSKVTLHEGDLSWEMKRLEEQAKKGAKT